MSRRILVWCGILAALLYIALNIVAPVLYEGYDTFSQTISELSAIGAPTRPMWVPFCTLYSILVIAFGLGVLRSGSGSKALRIAGVLIMLQAFIGAFWPPMHQREVLAAGGGTLTDTLHIIFTAVVEPLLMIAMGFAAAAFGRQFRIYTILTLLIMIGFGIMTGILSPDMEKNLPTPWMGIWERIILVAQMSWMIVFAILLLKKTDIRLVNTQLSNDPSQNLRRPVSVSESV